MDHQIIRKPKFLVAGKSICVSTWNGENQKQIPAFWQKCTEDGTLDRIISLNPEGNLLGVMADYNEVKGELTYFIAIEVSSKDNIMGMQSITIPASEWAVFSSVGPIPNSIQELFARIFSEWLPASIYLHGNAPELEVYLPGDPTSPDYVSEVWIPVVKKN